MRLEDLLDEVCAWCGKPFETNRASQKFCCGECRKQSQSTFWAHVRAEERRKANAGRSCKVCKTDLNTTDGGRHYCSKTCAEIARRWINRRYEVAAQRKREEARARLQCTDCGAHIEDAKSATKKRCEPCKALHRRRAAREATRAYRARKQTAE